LTRFPFKRKSKHYSNAHQGHSWEGVVRPLWSAELNGQETGQQNGYFKRKKCIFAAQQITITEPNIRIFHKCDFFP
jgi:hypothetical protein